MRAWLIVVALAGSASAEPFLAGRVTDAAGSAVAGASVSVVALEPTWKPRARHGEGLPLQRVLASASTDADGAFRIDGATVSAGFHALAVAAEGSPSLIRWTERIAFGPPALPIDLELRLPALATVHGLALDETGAPLPGLPLTAWSDGPAGASVVTARTDGAGRFTVRVPRSCTVTLVSVAPDRFAIVRASVPDAAELTLALHAKRLQATSGVLLSQETGQPIEGLTVRALAPSWDPIAPTAAEEQAPPWGDAAVLEEARTGAGGTWSLRVPRGGLALAVGALTVPTELGPGRTRVPTAEPLRGAVVDARGEPVVGADVRWSELPEVARSDAHGRFQLPPNMDASVIAMSAEGAVSVRNSPAPGVRFVLPAAALVEGEVRLPGSTDAPGAMAAGATVRVETGGAWDVLTATGPTGRFALGLRGAKKVTARQGRLRGSVAPSAIDESVTLSLREEAAPQARTGESFVRVACIDDQGRPLEGALARATSTLQQPSESVSETAGSGADGVAIVSVSGAARRDVLVTRPGHASAWLRGVTPGSSIQARLPRGATLTGLVKDATGSPVGAFIVVDREVSRTSMSNPMAAGEPRVAYTDAAGAFSMSDFEAGPHLVLAAALDVAPGAQERVVLAAGQATRLTLTLPAGARLRGIVRDASGPVAGVRIEVQARQSGARGLDSLMTGMPRHAVTMDDGTFAIDGLEPDTWYAVEAQAEWHAPASGGGRPAESLVELELVSTGRIAGHVTGERAIDEELSVTVECEPESQDVSDGHARESGASVVPDDGSFEVDALFPGVYACKVVTAVATASREGVEVRAGARTELALELEPLPAVELEILDAATGQPIARAWAWTETAPALTDARGRVRVALPARQPRDPAAGEPQEDEVAEIGVTAEGYVPTSLPIPDPPPKLLTVKLPPLPILRGRVVDPTGVAAEGAELSTDAGPAGVLTDAGGRFELQAPAEAGILSARRGHGAVFEQGRAAFDVAADGASDITIALARVETGGLTVLVVRGDEPVANAGVAVTGAEAWVQGRTDPAGTFVADDLHPGQVAVRVDIEGAGVERRRDVHLSPGERAQVTVDVGGGWTVEGRALRGGRPVEGVGVAWRPVSERHGVRGSGDLTHADGSFQLGPIPDEVDVVSVAGWLPSRGVHRKAEVMRGTGAVTLDFSSVAIEGRAMTGDSPVPEAWVSVDCPGSDPAMGITSQAGVFVVEDAPANASCEGFVQAEDLPPATFTVDTPADGRVSVGDVRLDGLTLHGHATAADGRPIAAISLALVTSAGRSAGFVSATVDEHGSFSVRVPPGRLAFVASAEDEALAPLFGEIPEGRVELEFQPAAVLEIVAREADGTPADAFARMLAWNELREGHPLMSWSHGLPEDDAIVFGGLPAGHVVVEVLAGSRGSRIEADVAAGEVTRMSVTLPTQ